MNANLSMAVLLAALGLSLGACNKQDLREQNPAGTQNQQPMAPKPDAPTSDASTTPRATPAQ